MKEQKKRRKIDLKFDEKKFKIRKNERNIKLDIENKGITLIALIISIIVLLILAGVSLSALIGENGILNQAVNSAEKTKMALEQEAIEQIIVSESADKIQYPEEKSKYHIGIDLIDKSLENGNSWNIIVVNESQKSYGTGWTYIEKGTELMDYGKSNYSWLINYKTGEKVRLEEGEYTRLDYSLSMAVTEGLIFNIDPTILEGVSQEELQNNPEILGENVELKNFNWTEESGLTSKSFNFDGKDDHINILYDDQEKLNELYNNGLTFEYYGTIEEGAHVDYEGNPADYTSFTRNIWIVEWK